MKGKKQKPPRRNLRDLLYGNIQEKLSQNNPFAIDKSESNIRTSNVSQVESNMQSILSKYPQAIMKLDNLDREEQSFNYRNRVQFREKKVQVKRSLDRRPISKENSFRNIIPKEARKELYIPQLNNYTTQLNEFNELDNGNNFDVEKDTQTHSSQITKEHNDEQEQYIKENNLTFNVNQRIEINEGNALLPEDQINYFFSLPPVENLLWEHTFPEEQRNIDNSELYFTPGRAQEVSNIELDPNNLFKNTHFEQPAQRIYLSQQPIAQEHKSILKYPHYIEEKKNSFNKSINMSDFINFDYTLSNKKSQKSIKEVNNSNKSNNDETTMLKSNIILDDLPNQFDSDTERQDISSGDQKEHLVLTEQQNDELDDNLEMNELDGNSIIDSENDRLNSSINYEDNDVYSLNDENNNRLDDMSDNNNSLYENDSNLDENWEEFKNEMGYEHSELSQYENNITLTPINNLEDNENNNENNSDADSDAELWNEFKNSINYSKNIETNSFDENSRALKTNVNISRGKNTFDSDDENNSDPDYEENFNGNSDTSVTSYIPGVNHQNGLNDFDNEFEKNTPNNNLDYTQLDQQQNLFDVGIYSKMNSPNNLNDIQQVQENSKYNIQGDKNFIKNKNIAPTEDYYNNFNDMNQGLERTDNIRNAITGVASSLIENAHLLNDKKHTNTPVLQNVQKKGIVNTYFTPKYGGVSASKLRFQGLDDSNLEKEFMNDYTHYLNDPKYFNNKSLLSSKVGVNKHDKNNVLASNQNIQKLDALFRHNQSSLSSRVAADDMSNQNPDIMNNLNKRRGNNIIKLNGQNKDNNNSIHSDAFLRQDILNSSKVKILKSKKNQTTEPKGTKSNHKAYDDTNKPSILPKQTLYDKIVQPEFRNRNSIRDNDYNDYDEIDYDAILKPTPVIKSFKLSMLLGCDVLLKLENSLPGQTHKIRGILQWICEMTRLNGIPFNNGKINFVVSGSVNKCLASIAAVQLFNYNIERIKNEFMFSDPLSITVIVPSCITKTILRKMQGAYVTVIKLGESWEGNRGLAEDYAQKLERDNKWNKDDEQDMINLAVPNTIHPLITNGLVNVGKELNFQLRGATPDVILCPVGSGSLLAGLVEGLHNSIRMVGVPIIAVETQSTDLLHKHILADKMLPTRRPTHSSIASLNESTLNFDAFKACLKHPVIPLVVSDHMAENAATLFSDDHALRIESASGAALSPIYHALITKLIPNLTTKSTVVIIVTGGNILEKKNYNQPIIQAKSLEESYFEYQDNFKVLSDKTYIPENCTAEEQRKRASLIRKIDNYNLERKKEGNLKRSKRKKNKDKKENQVEAE